ncbi:hypothetical protein WJX64_11685 [Leifsonia sp. YIM 134122]|uniref:MarR family transcriptional regulator n=1 Tax=Leifsonia stereocauli TaxID=3134136 RepID=A0ABU9W5D3_9MICO
MSAAVMNPAEADDRIDTMLILQYALVRGSIVLGELGRAMDLAPDAATAVVRGLVRDGSVLCRIRGRNSENVEVFLTAAGRERARREGAAVVRAATDLLREFAPAERKVVEQALGLRPGEAELRDA